MRRVDDEEATGPDFACVSDGNGWHRFEYSEPIGRALRPQYNQITCPTTTKSTAEQIDELRRLLDEQHKRRREERELERMLSAARHEAEQQIERQIAAVSAAIKSTPAAELAAIFKRLT
jgi:small-conductance mechanosensitive channel